MPISTSKRVLGAALLFLAAQLAHAQYVWIDANGTRQYADRPPPPGTPPHKILKAPGRLAPAPTPDAGMDATQPGAAEAKPALPKGPPSLAEREQDFRKRAQERAEQERKDAIEAERRRELAERCEAARDAQAQLASGIRIARFDQNGERSYMSDEERAAKAAQVNRVLKDCR